MANALARHAKRRRSRRPVRVYLDGGQLLTMLGCTLLVVEGMRICQLPTVLQQPVLRASAAAEPGPSAPSHIPAKQYGTHACRLF